MENITKEATFKSFLHLSYQNTKLLFLWQCFLIFSWDKHNQRFFGIIQKYELRLSFNFHESKFHKGTYLELHLSFVLEAFVTFYMQNFREQEQNSMSLENVKMFLISQKPLLDTLINIYFLICCFMIWWNKKRAWSSKIVGKFRFCNRWNPQSFVTW